MEPAEAACGSDHEMVTLSAVDDTATGATDAPANVQPEPTRLVGPSPAALTAATVKPCWLPLARSVAVAVSAAPEYTTAPAAL